MKSIIEDLNTPPPFYQYREAFDQFPRANVALKLGVSTSYLANILNGFSKPGKDLEKRMAGLAQEIQKAQAQ